MTDCNFEIWFNCTFCFPFFLDRPRFVSPRYV